MTEQASATKRFSANNRVILTGLGYDAQGPHLILTDLEKAKMYKFALANQTFMLTKKPGRYCVGSFDLETFKSEVCPDAAEILPDSKETSCKACLEKTGFNPSFYYSAAISEQQKAYNATPHFVYLVYFAPGYLKVGISAESRNIERLLEQGARAAMVLGRFANAEQARSLEAKMCAQEGIYETMSSNKKLNLLCEAPFDFEEATKELTACIEKYALDPISIEQFVPGAKGKILNLQPYYSSQDFGDAILINGSQEFKDVCGGLCVGMLGSNLIFKQDDSFVAVSIKSWVSHIVELDMGKPNFVYDVKPVQLSLF